MRCSVLLVSLLCLSSLALAEEAPSATETEETLEIPVEELTVVRVSSTPIGAEISVDGYSCGQTPALISVSPGRHEMVLVLGERQMRIVVMASQDFTSEVSLDFGIAADSGSQYSLFDEPRTAPPEVISEQAQDDEGLGTEGPPSGDVEERWIRRIPQTPWFELQFLTGALKRSFFMPIDPVIDIRNRGTAVLKTGMVATLGFSMGIYPFAGFRIRHLRGFGVEGGALMALGIDLINEREDTSISATSYEADVAVAYHATIGQPDRGTVLSLRLGWHRTSFDIGRSGNDIVPPFAYDAVRLGFGVRVPLATRFFLAEVRGSYIGVTSVGDNAAQAYGEGDPSSNGIEFQIGVLGRVGSLELGLSWIGKWFWSNFTGVGAGWGEGFESTAESGGIESQGQAHDSFQQLRITLGFRI